MQGRKRPLPRINLILSQDNVYDVALCVCNRGGEEDGVTHVIMNELQDLHIATIKDAARKLTGTKRRAFQAQVALDYLDGSARRAEAVFGWSRRTVILGLHELRTGLTCVDNTSARGNRPTEEK